MEVALRHTRIFHHAGLRVLAAALLATAAACGGDGGGTDPDPAITVAVGPATASVIQGASATVPVTITRSGGFAGPVSLTLTGAPEGVTGTFDPTPIPAGATASTLTLTVAAGVEPGDYPLTVRATGDGVDDKTDALALTVTAAATPSFALALTPAALTLVQGETKTSAVAITRAGGFTDAVGLAVTGAPAGLTATVEPASATADAATITVAAAASTAPGTYQLTVTGTATGLTDQTAQLSVTVTAAPASQSGSFAFCEDDLPVWLAVQNGDGPWTPVTAGANNTFTFNLPTTRGGVAYVTQNGTNYDIEVIYASTTEFNLLTGNGANPVSVCSPPETGKTVTGSVTGLDDDQIAFITLGTSFAQATPLLEGGSFTLRNVPDGEQTLIATRLSSGTGSSFAVNKIIVRHGVNPGDGTALPVLDFGASEAVDPASADVTIQGIGGDVANLGVSLVTSGSSFFGFGGSAFLFSAADITSANATQTYYGVPDAQLATGDLHVLQAFAQPPGEDPTTSRFALQYFRSVTDQTLTLGPPLTEPVVSVLAVDPYLRLRALLTVQTEYNQFASASFTQEGHSATVAMTGGYLAGATQFDLAIPDLSGAAGFQATWGPVAGVETSYDISAIGGTFAFGFLGQRPTNGSTTLFASSTGTITNPSLMRARR
jgi:hypothetical protein